MRAAGLGWVGSILLVPALGLGQVPPSPPPEPHPAAVTANPPPARTDSLPSPPGSAAPGLGSPALPAPTVADTTTRTFRLRAGRARAYFENGERVTILEAGVALESEGTTVESRRARAYRERELAYFYEDVVVHDRDVVMNGDTGEFSRPGDYAILTGRVRIRDPRGLIHADRARYWRTDRIIWLWGHVDFKDEKTRVQADSVLYHEVDGVGEAFGNVVVTDLDSGSEARGPHAIYDRNTGLARLDPQPQLVLKEKGKDDTAVDAAKIEFNRDKSVVRAHGNVRIRRGDTVASGDSAFLYKNRDQIELRGHPMLQQQATRMRGREIDVHYHDDRVERVEVRHGAQLVQSRTDTLLIRDDNTVQGDSATLYFEAGELRRAVVVGGASSVYVPQESRPDRISINEAQADSIVMVFAKNDVEEVVFTGNASGTYRYFEGDLVALRRPQAARFDSTFGVVRGDTTRFDFRKRAETVEYRAERILYLAPQNDLRLQEAAEVTYQGNTLRAGHIHYDADTDLLDATDRPVLDDAGSRLYGETMGYDMGTKHAWVRGASTTYDQGFYSGRALRKNDANVLQVAHGSYTTCDLAHPHYRFECDQMKVYLHEKVVGRPVRVYLGNVPILWAPFLYNSVKTDRHSGFLQPDIQIGVTSRQRYIRGLAYYWAASRYFDFLVSGDYTDHERPDRSTVGTVLRDTLDTRSFGLRVDTRYKVRYLFDGNLSYASQRDFQNDRHFWSLRGAHDQKFGERTTLRGSLDYASSSQAQRIVYENVDLQRSLQRQLTSAATFNHPGDLLSFSINLNRRQVIEPGERFTGSLVSNVVPQVTLSFRPIRLGPTPPYGEDTGLRAFMHSLELRPRVDAQRTTTELRELKLAAEIPPGGVVLADSFKTVHQEVVTANTGASLSRQVHAWIFNLSPAVSYDESYRKDSSFPTAKRNTRHVGTGLGASTTFYGLFHPNVWGLTAIRHRIDPRATINYTPEIAGQQRRSTTVGLSLGNTIDVKMRSGKETRRLDGLFDWSLSTFYNPTVLGTIPGEPDRKFGNIASTITINRSGPLRMTISQTYDPYRGRILETRVPFGLHLTGKFGYGDTGLEEAERNRVVQEQGQAERDSTARADSIGAARARSQNGRPEDAAMDELHPVKVGAAGALGWDLGLSYSLVRTIVGPTAQNVGVLFAIQPTRNWHIGYRTSYDGTVRAFVNPDIRITRDLHCWKASFSRVKYYDEWRYYFRIYVERHQQDLFYESGDRGLGY